MASAVRLRTDFTAGELRQLAKNATTTVPILFVTGRLERALSRLWFRRARCL